MDGDNDALETDTEVEADTDVDLETDIDESEITPSSAVGKFRRTSAGAVLNGVALGLRDVFDPVIREEAPIQQEAPGAPPEPRSVDTHLDPDDPTASSVTLRPWLIEE